MSRSGSYSHPNNMAGQSRYASTQATSSAFSASANPNEDWTKISDLAERRRIQNRIAQRNYRKKLKRRLEDLERRAGSSSASPEQTHSELDSLTQDNHQQEARPSRRISKPSISHEQQQLSPEVLQLDDSSTLFNVSRQIPPPASSHVTFSTYPPATAYLPTDFQQSTTYQTNSDHYPGYQYSLDFSHSLPPTLPSMLNASYVAKQDQDQDLFNPLSMNYASLAGLPTEYPASNSQVNPANFFPPRSFSTPQF